MTPEALARIHAAATATDRAWSAAEFRALLARPGALLGHAPGAFALGHAVADEAELLMLATEPACRRRGLGREVLAQFHDAAAAAGARRALLEVASDNVAARALYAQAGYTSCGLRRGYYTRPGRPAADALILARDLPGDG